MKEYIIAVICCGIIGGLVSFIAPEGDGGGISRSVKLVVGLVLTVVCISPIFRMLDALKNFDIGDLTYSEDLADGNDYEEIFESGYISAENENLKYGIINILESRFGVAEGESSVSFTFVQGEERKLESLFITLYGASVWKDTGAIEEYFEEILGCRVITAIG